MARKIFALFLIFIAFYMGAHYYIRWKNTVYDDVSKIGRLVECEPNEFRAISITTAGGAEAGSMRFERVDVPVENIPAVTQVSQWHWRIVDPVQGEADPTLVRRIASTICELYDPLPMRDGDFKPADSKDRHAEQVVAMLDSKMGKRSVDIRFGAAQADHTDFVRVTQTGKTEKTYRIPHLLGQISALPRDAFRNMRVMRLEADNVQRVALTIDGKERFTLERAGADWKVLSGGKALGDGAEEASRFLNRISTLRAIGILEEGKTGRDCESMKAKVSLALDGLAGKTEALRFDYAKTGDVVACSNLGSQKFRVHRDLIPFLDVPVKALLVK